jgi:putative ABC transport system permease protein
MFTLTLAGLRERWPLFIGALLSVVVGVALLASAMTVAGSANPPDHTGLSPRQAFEVRDAFDAVATVMIISAMLAGVLAVFIVATTFAFTVAERRRDIALLRLLGAGRRQVRIVLLGEALVLGVVGSAIGLALTRPAVSVQMWLLRRAAFVPDGFSITHPSWPLWTAAGIGVGVAVLGVLAASRRASRVLPLEAIRDGTGRTRVMTPGRWMVGAVMLLLTAIQILAAAFVGLVVALALGLGVAITGAIALSQLAPVMLRMATRVLGLPLRPTTLGTLAEANGREGIQRSASTAAPVIVLVALVISVTSALAATTAAVTAEERDHTTADLVVTTTGAHIESIVTIPGVTAVSPESTPDLVIDLPIRTGDEAETELFFDRYAVIDPAGYDAVHPITPVAGSLERLSGDTIAVMEQPTDGTTFNVGDPATVTIGTEQVQVRIAAILPERLSTDQQILLPQDLVPAEMLASAHTDVLVQVRSDSDVDGVRAAAESYGEVIPVEVWITANAEALQHTNNATLVVLLALAGLYTVMAVVNAVVIAGTGRRREHAIARLSGLTRTQVVATSALEAAITIITGLLLGLVVVASAILGIALAARRSVGSPVIEIPWALLTATTLGSLGIAVGISALVAALVTGTTSPITIAAARE